jgi:hypothetical protein
MMTCRALHPIIWEILKCLEWQNQPRRLFLLFPHYTMATISYPFMVNCAKTLTSGEPNGNMTLNILPLQMVVDSCMDIGKVMGEHVKGN